MKTNRQYITLHAPFYGKMSGLRDRPCFVQKDI